MTILGMYLLTEARAPRRGEDHDNRVENLPNVRKD
jgi:hypothetical protein